MNNVEFFAVNNILVTPVIGRSGMEYIYSGKMLVEPAKIVFCKDCEFGIVGESGTIDCTGKLVETWDYYNDEPKDNLVEPYGFCAWGKRKEVK